MTELISLASLPAISSSIDPIYIGPSAPLALPAAGIRAILRRTKSMGCRRNRPNFEETTVSGQNDDHVGHSRGRTKSPVRANSKRRRSAATAPRSIETRYPSEIDPSLPRRGSVELVSGAYRSPPFRALSRPHSQSRATSSQRSPSRGRTRRRDVTPYSSIREKARRHNKRSNVSRPRKHTPGRGPPSGPAERSSPCHADVPAVDVSSYITKGAFRLYNHREPELFRFPKLRSQPEPSWRAGDGFSDDEATPDSVFLMTGKHKRKRSRSLSAFGQLSIEAENIVKINVGEVNFSQPEQRPLYRLRGKVRNVAMKEAWPTRENFTESTIEQKSRKLAVENHSSTPSPNSERAAVSKPDVKRTIPLKRMTSGFENLGKGKRRYQSNNGRNPFFSFVRLLPEYEDQVGDVEYEGEDGWYERMEDKSEHESDAFEYTYAPTEVEGIHSSSERLGEDDSDDLDDDMQDVVLDSQADEVLSSNRDLGHGQISTAHAMSMGRLASSRIGPGVNCP